MPLELVKPERKSPRWGRFDPWSAGQKFDPYSLPDNAAIYSLAGAESDSTYLTNGSGRLMLVADRSGNSAVNGLVLHGVAGNYASTPSSTALKISGDIDIRCYAALPSWSPLIYKCFLAKDDLSTNRDYLFATNNTGSNLFFRFTTDGTTAFAAVSSVGTGFLAYSANWVRVTYDSVGGNVIFYTSSNGVNWTQLGATQSVTPGSIHTGDTSLNIGVISGVTGAIAGSIYRAQVYGGISGTLVFDADFSKPAKLSGTFVESSVNAATVTVNSTGDFGARICGARDLVQLTATKMPAISANVATFDGSNDCLRSAPYAEAQPRGVYLVGSMVAWSDGMYLIDGASAADTAAITMSTATPQLNISAGSSVAGNTGLAVGTRGVLTATFNGASSALGVNKTAETTGDAGAGVPKGSTLGSSGAATGGTNAANITFCEEIRRSVVDDTATKAKIQSFLASRWSVAI